MIVYFPLYFQVFLFGVYKQYTQFMSIAIAWFSLEYDILAHVARIYSILWKFQDVTGLISYGWYSEVYTHLTAFHYCIIVPWCLPIFTAFILCTPCTHCVDLLTWFLCIRNVYIWYTNSTHFSTKRYIVYTTCIHPISFSRLHIRPSHIYAFSNITFSYCPSRLRMLASG